MMEEACKSCGKDAANLRGDTDKMRTTVREFVEGQIFKVQDHYTAKIRLMSHKHSEGLQVCKWLMLEPLRKWRRPVMRKLGRVKKTFEGKLIT